MINNKFDFNFRNPLDWFYEGLRILWENTPDFQLQILDQNDRYIHCLIQDDNKKSNWMGTFIYDCRHHHLQWKPVGSN